MSKEKKQIFIQKIVSIIAISTILLLVISLPVEASPLANWKNSAASTFQGGDGSKTSPYQIHSPAQLALLSNKVNSGSPCSGKYFILTGDINLKGKDWSSIGDTTSSKFSGIFNGSGHKITGLTIGSSKYPNGSLSFCGLFGVTSGSTIENVSVNVSIYSSQFQAELGSLAASNNGIVKKCYAGGTLCSNTEAGIGGLLSSNNGNISNSYSSCTISGGINANIGGLVKDNSEGSITSCHSKCTIKGGVASKEGGLVESNSGTITNCYVAGKISGKGYTAGGLAGLNMSNGKIKNSYATNSVSSASRQSTLGGLVSDNRGTILNSHASGSVSDKSSESISGGLMGTNNGTVTGCYSTGSVSGGSRSFIGGFSGENYSLISNCYSKGSVSGGQCAGGLIGENRNIIANSYSVGAVKSLIDNACVGGFIGSNSYGTIKNCYSAGTTVGTDGSCIGGFIGNNDSHSTIKNGYWLKSAASKGIGDGKDNTTSMEASEIKSLGFVTMLNNNISSLKLKGAKKWLLISIKNSSYPVLNGIGDGHK